ncbi:hypothetical protein GCM10027085_49660 [Spirosoma aerophilum]
MNACRIDKLRPNVFPKSYSFLRVWWALALLFVCGGALSSLGQTITGTVYRDFNSDGAYTAIPSSGTYAYGEPGVAGVVVKAFNASGVVSATATTTAAGTYTLNVGSSSQFRVEFTNLASSDYESFRGTNSATSVQFTTGGTSGVNLGINYPRNYCQSNPSLLVACYLSGNPLASGSDVANLDALVKVPYTATNTTPSPTELGTAAEIGSVWGTAYQRSTKKLFSAAFLKRHTGLGPLGLGGIYVTTVGTSPTSTTYANVQTLGITNLGTTALGTRGLPASGLTSSSDPTAFTLVGKAGLGGMALSEDESKLYVIDLFNKQLIILNIGNPAKASLTAADVQTLAIPDPGCTDGVARPFGITVYKGKAYVGVVCTGENNFATAKANLKAYVYAMDETTQTFNTTPVITVPLNYPKGDVHHTYPALGDVWNPWTDTFSNFNTNNTNAFATRTALPQPVLSSIAFTDNGDMVLGFMDRAGHQLGYRQRAPGDNSGTPVLYSGYVGGDILRAHFDGAQWNLENNGRISTATSASGVGNNQGPGGGEFYAKEEYLNATTHQETMQGGLAVVSGTNQLVATVMDPLSVFSGGFSWFSNTDGDDDRRYQVYISSTAGDVTLGKANGLGGIAVACDEAPIEIGNRVWMDANDNGIQDAGEPGIAGVKVTLTGPGLTSPVSVTTNSSGEYYFSNTSGTAATGFAYSLTGLTSGSSYSLTFPSSASANTLVLSTKPNSATGTNTDLIDTDPSSAGLISFTLGESGQNNFSFDAGYVTPACSLSLTPTVSGCYSTTAGSKVTVSVEVAWENAPAGEYIVITSGAQSRTITPGTITITYPQVVGTLTGQSTIVSPQVVAFEVDANSSTGSITAKFNSTTACLATASFTTPAPCLPTACATGSDLGGTVFKDFNDNGTKESGETAGVPAVTVKAIACDGTVYTTTTDAYGRYTLSIPPANYPVRVEFSNVPGVYNLGVNGANSRTTVQFVNAPNCTTDLGVNNPIDYCSNTPDIFVPCYVYGDPLVTGSSSATSAALVSIPYGVSSITFQGENPLASASKIGSVWGAAYNKTTKKLFLSAVLKRHAGLGPAGLSGIYVTDYSNPASVTTTTFLSVSAIGIDVGTIASNSSRGLVGDKTQPSRDPDSFSLTAKAGIGDLEISEDGNKLWLMNLNDQKLYSIDITQFNTDGVTKPTAANVNSFIIPATCVNGEFRPWALKVYNGKVYVGGVCDAQTSGDKSDLRASVYELNGSTFTKVFDFPLTYPKGYPAAANRNITGWFPWTDTFNDLLDGSTTLRHPVPIFTDIEFDIDGSMVLAFGDRTGFQGGDRNYRPDGTSTTLYETNSQAGDLLRAFYSNGAFVLENNAKAGPNIGYGANNSQGPGFGEFYNDNWVQEGGTNVLYHAEEVMGGLALKPGSGEVVVTTIDPVDGHPYAGGVRYMSNSTGQVTGSYSVYITRGPDGSPNPGTFAKATGLGDIELSCNTITLLEIGNRVWRDDNQDGVQDACEPPLAGVTVSLYQNGTLVASTTTNTSGEYYFNNNPVSSTVAGTVSNTAIQPNTAYQIVFGKTQFANDLLTLSGNKYILTQVNSTTTNANDLNDSDALIATVAGTTAPVISVTTGNVGSVNHTYDVGFIQTASLGDFAFEDKNTNGVQDATDTPIAGVVVTLYTNGVASLTTTTNASGLYSFTGLTPGSSLSYSVGFTQPAGYTTITANAGNDDSKDSDGLPATGITGVYTLTAGENNTTVDMGYVKLASLGDFVFVDEDKDGIQDANEDPIPGVVVTLYINGVSSTTTTTNASGLYSFTGLTPGSSFSYAVGFTTPTGYTATIPLSGTDKTIDSDPVNGITAAVTLTSGENNPTLDAGFYLIPAGLGDFVFLDSNRDGIQDANELGIQGVDVTLYVNGVVSLTTTTNASGFYSFTGLTPGSLINYGVGFAAPTSYTATLQNTGSDDAKDSDADLITGKTQSVTLAPGEFNPTLDAGFFLPETIQVLVGTPICNTLTNQYTATGTVNLTNAIAGNLTITDNGGNLTVIAITTGQTTATFSLTGISGSTPPTHTVIAGFGTATASTTYATPASCTVCSTSLTTANLPNGQANTAYSQTLITTGGTLPYTYTVLGNLPAGLSLEATTGVISGTPTSASATSFSVVVTDAKACSDVAALSITVTALPVCSLEATATPGVCNTATNTYTVTGTISATNAAINSASPQTLTVSVGSSSTVVTLTGDGPVSYTLTGLTSDGLTQTVSVVSSATACGTTSVTYTAPASCSIAPPALSVLVSTPLCNSVTNTYTATGSISLSNIVSGSLTLTDNGTTLEVITLTVGQTTASFSVSGVSDASSHTLIATLTGGTSASATYTAPVACTVCSTSLTTASLPNGQVDAPYSQTITATGGTLPYTYTVLGTLPAGLSLEATTGVISGTPTSATTTSFSVVVTDAKSCSDVAALSITVTALPVCSLEATATPGVCNTATNTYTLTGTVSATNAAINSASPQTLTVSVGSSSTVVTLTDNGPVSYTLAGLTSDGLTQTVSVVSSATACGTTSVTFTAPASCSGAPALSLEKMVSRSKAKIGDILTYTLVLTNTGTGTATNVVVTDSTTAGLTFVPGSVSAPAGSTFTQGTPISTWTVASLPAAQSLSLTFQARADSSGILYNKATIPGDTATVCTTIPVRVCAGDSYTFRLEVAPGRSSYKWYRDGEEIVGQNTNVLEVSAPGSYSLAVDNVTGKCPDFSCCPFIIEEAPLPTFRAVATPVTCVGNSLQTNGKITLSDFKPTQTYQYSLGSSFNQAAVLSGSAKVIPANGIIVSTLSNPAVAQAYTVRVYNGSGCYKDVTVLLLPTICGCPADVCVPFVLQQTKRPKRIGNAQ